MDRWELLEGYRDLGVRRLLLIFWEAHLSSPNEVIVGAGLVLIAPRVYKHVRGDIARAYRWAVIPRSPGRRDRREHLGRRALHQ